MNFRNFTIKEHCNRNLYHIIVFVVSIYDYLAYTIDIHNTLCMRFGITSQNDPGFDDWKKVIPRRHLKLAVLILLVLYMILFVFCVAFLIAVGVVVGIQEGE